MSSTDEQSSDVDIGSSESTFIPEFLTIEPRANHTATVIWLHGLGDTGEGMQPAARSLSRLPNLGHVKFILPHAPTMSVTGNGGLVMPSWYSTLIRSDPETHGITYRLTGLFRSVKWINNMVDEEVRRYNIPLGRIIVGGLSQGGAVALLTAITLERRIAGIFALSSYVPMRTKVPELMTPLSSSIPIFWGHGALDIQVRHPFSVTCAETFATQLGIPFELSESKFTSKNPSEDLKIPKIRFQTYPDLGHWFCSDELDDLAVWISALVPSDG